MGRASTDLRRSLGLALTPPVSFSRRLFLPFFRLSPLSPAVDWPFRLCSPLARPIERGKRASIMATVCV